MGFLSGLKGIIRQAEKITSANNVSGVSKENVSTNRTNAVSGDSWGIEMPNEENQFNYPGTFEQYFENIFANDFTQYRVEKEYVRSGIVVYRFYQGALALIVEIMSDQVDSSALRKKCSRENIPYCRFYYDHKKWWNTRSYVVRRIQEMLS